MLTQIPQTLLEAVRYLADPDRCLNLMVGLRWPNGVTCPRCDCAEVSFLSTRRIWKCKGCKKQFSVKVGTIFEDSPLSLDKWLVAIWFITNAKNSASSHELHRVLGITQKSAWFMLHRIREAMKSGTFLRLSGEIEVDETFVGGKRGNMHKDRQKKHRVGSLDGKTAVMGLLERDGKVVAKVIPNTKMATLQPHMLAHIAPGSTVYTDAFPSYTRMDLKPFVHKVIDHEKAYAIGDTHTNGIENFWSLFKRCVKGTWIHIDREHTDRYLAEQSFRFNNRKSTDSERFTEVASSVAGKRITYKQLIGKDETPCP